VVTSLASGAASHDDVVVVPGSKKRRIVPIDCPLTVTSIEVQPELAVVENAILPCAGSTGVGLGVVEDEGPVGRDDELHDDNTTTLSVRMKRRTPRF